MVFADMYPNIQNKHFRKTDPVSQIKEQFIRMRNEETVRKLGDR